VPILIDGHNLIGRLPMLSLQDPDDEEKLVRLLQPYRARTRKAITVIFDPGAPSALPKTRRLGGIAIVFAPSGSSADAVIVRRVKKARNPHDWLVITSDRELAEAVARQGARVKSADDFALELNAPQEGAPDWKEKPLSSDEVDWWLAQFGKRDN